MSCELDVFIVAYHARAALGEAVHSIALWTTPGYRLTVYDNSERNLPLTWLWNRFFGQSKRRFVAVCNPDIVVSDGWASEALACMAEHPECGVVSPLTNHEFHAALFPGHTPLPFEPASGRSVSERLTKLQAERFVFSKDYRAAPGHCFVIRREAWAKVGGFNEGLPFAGNDYDFNQRVLSASMSIGICTRAACHHKWNQSTKEASRLGTFDAGSNCPKFSTPPSGAGFSDV